MTRSPRLRVGLIGDPVAHSLSPAMQQPALDALGVPATYELWQTPTDHLPARMGSMRAPDTLGANVTVPHKLAVMAHLDQISALAQRAGAVNTIIHRDGRLIGDNTDVYGFARALIAACPDAANRAALILGAGGAARAVALGLEQIGVGSIAVANRNRERAERLAADLAPVPIVVVSSGADSLPSFRGYEESRRTKDDGEIPRFSRNDGEKARNDGEKARNDEMRATIRSAGILINATSLGWHRGEIPLAPDLLSSLSAGALVVDLTYRDTDLLRAARERGYQTLDGLAMLVHQGARALELWTGKPAPVAVMMDAAIRARAARG